MARFLRFQGLFPPKKPLLVLQEPYTFIHCHDLVIDRILCQDNLILGYPKYLLPWHGIFFISLHLMQGYILSQVD